MDNTGFFEETEECRNRILSNEYEDFILPGDRFLKEQSLSDFFCGEMVSENWGIIHVNRRLLPPASVQFYDYTAIPRLYGLTDTTNMEASGILRARNQPVLGLDGQGVLIGLLDTGIDYENPAFLDGGGKSRILRGSDHSGGRASGGLSVRNRIYKGGNR